MLSGKKSIVSISMLALMCLITTLSGTTEARSVYVISDTTTWSDEPSIIQAYDVQDSNLVYQTDYETVGRLAIGLAIDTDSEFLFITFEQENEIELVNAKTMQYVDTVTAPGASDLAGIVYDSTRQKVYVVDRADKYLYVYNWYPAIPSLVLDGDPIELEGLINGDVGGAWGIALDEQNERLWVTSNETKVQFYDTNDWSHDPNSDYITVSQKAVGIALDLTNNYVYTGTAWVDPFPTSYLSQYDLLADPNNAETLEYIGAEVIGIAVDQETSLVYLTTFGTNYDEYYPDPPEDRLFVYDCNLSQQWESGDIGNPTGVAVEGNVSYKSPDFLLVKDNNDPNDECVRPLISEYEHQWIGTPYNWLYYNIDYDANGHADTNVRITDYLPAEVNYISSDPVGDYNSTERTVSWYLGDLPGTDSNCFEVVTAVNYYARPGGVITNLVVMEGDTYLNEATCDVNVCAYGTEIIYVDKDANDPNSYNNGTSWDDAYRDLQDGLTGARNCDALVTAIWVAEGTYKPTWDAENFDGTETFELVEDVGLFGHFGGVGTYETSPDQRNFADANNETILEGQIGGNYYEAVKYIVKAEDIQDAIVDGFTIRGSYSGDSYSGAGIYLDDADVAIVNCKLKDNGNYGVYATATTSSSFPDIHNCLFMDNSTNGLYCVRSRPAITNSVFDGNNITPRAIYASASVIEMSDCTVKNHTANSISVWDTDIEIEGCCIKNNSSDAAVYFSDSNLVINHSVIEHNSGTGIYCLSGSTLSLTNSVIRFNGNHGIFLEDMLTTTIKNNWIHNNGADGYGDYDCGIFFYGQISQPLVRNNTIIDNLRHGIYSYSGTEPNVVNCIIYENGTQIGTYNGEPLENVKYSCIEGGYGGTGNISGDPSFKNPTDPNDLHLAGISPCKDAGDPNGNYGDETDIDGEDRIKYGRVDMGADEYYWSPADFDEDGTVNFIDYAILAAAWQSEPNDGNYDEDCDLEDNNSIDYNDLALFCEDWLWQAGWEEEMQWMMMGGGGMGFGFESIILESSKTALTSDRDALMLSTASESLEARPERLVAKSQKFYDITPATTISGKRKALEIEKIDIKKILKWLDEIWLNEEVRKVITEDEWREFVEAVKSELE